MQRTPGMAISANSANWFDQFVTDATGIEKRDLRDRPIVETLVDLVRSPMTDGKTLVSGEAERFLQRMLRAAARQERQMQGLREVRRQPANRVLLDHGQRPGTIFEAQLHERGPGMGLLRTSRTFRVQVNFGPTSRAESAND